MLNSGRRGSRSPDGYGILSVNEHFNQTNYPIPIINSWAITDGSYNPTDDTALNTAGGQTVVVYGSGFRAGITVNINGSNISPVTLLDQGRITFTAPALSSATYTIYASNTDGATAIYVPGLVYSGLPTWSSPAAGSIGSTYETKSVSNLTYTSFTATGDAPITYSILSGSLPSGVTLSSSGTLSGTLPASSSPTTYSFTIRATDAQNQDSDRSFSLTINPDVVTWVAPTQNGSLTVYETQAFSTPLSATSAAGYGVMYAANTLPTGISLVSSNGAFTGYANTVGNTYALLTATANTTGRSATSNVTFTVNQDVVTWSSPANNNTDYSLSLGAAMSPVSLSATAATGYGIQYAANALPSGVTLNENTISGTPSGSGTTYTQLTATSNTTNRVAYAYISWTVSIGGDAYFANTALLLSANSSTQTSSFVTDNSNNNSQLVVTGDTRAQNFNPYQLGYYSNYFDGTGDYLTTPTSTRFGFGTGDFTMECWVYPIAWNSTTDGFLSCEIGTSTASGVSISRDGVDYGLNSGSSVFTAWSNVIQLGQWQHLAVSRSGTTMRMFYNGTVDHTLTVTQDLTSSRAFVIGRRLTDYDGYYSKAYISNVRVVKGQALYTAAFTPSTSPLTAVANTSLLTCQSNRLIDNSVNNFTITKNGDTTVSSAHPFSTVYQAGTPYYSVFFDGTGDKISNSSFPALGTGELTVEGWFYTTGYNSSSDTLFGIGDSVSGPYTNITILGGSNSWELCFRGTVSQPLIDTLVSTTNYPGLNTWVHHAVTRDSSGTVRWFINGTQVYINTYAMGNLDLTGIYLAYTANFSPNYFKGYISNFRVVKGTAVYTSAFTPPTNPLTAISNTVFLSCQSNTLIDNSSNAYALTVSGDTKPVAVSPFTPSSYSNTAITTYGSAYFDGTGDYIKTYSTPGVQFGTGDFTVECWAWLHSSAGGYASFFSTTPAATYYGVVLSRDMIGVFAPNGAGGTTISVNVPVNTWTHIALTRSGTTMRVFLNGVLAGSTTDSTNINSNLAVIGARYVEASDYLCTGYISDVRVVKGTALYTSNFVPQSTSPLTAVANTQLLTLQTNGSHNNSVFKDESSFGNIITRTGNPTQGTFSPYGDNWSYYFDGSATNYLTLTLAQSPGTTLTFEAWVYPIALTTNHRIFGGTLDLYVDTSGTLGMNGGAVYTATNTIIKNTWQHVVVIINSGVASVYVNGVSKSLSGTNSGLNITGTTNYIGQYSGGGAYTWNGYISNLRLVKNKVVYTGNFTPPIAPLTELQPAGTNIVSITGSDTVQLLTCQSNRIIDNSKSMNTFTINGTVPTTKFSPFSTVTVPKYYSTYFDGVTTTSYLTIPNNSAFDFPSDFTIEWWSLKTSNGSNGYDCVVGTDTSGTGATWFVELSTSRGLALVAASSIRASNNSITINDGKWHHYAVSRSSGSIYLFQDGVQLGTPVSYSSTLSSSGVALQIGREGTYPYNGYISNLRIVKGTGLYTSNFTTPTAPLAAIANTVVLTCQNNTFVDNSNNNFAITVTGAKPIPVSPFTPTANTITNYSPTVFGGSMYFDGSGDGLITDYTTFTGSGTNNFTYEAWVYFTSVESGCVMGSADSSSNISGIAIIYLSASGTLRVFGPSTENNTTTTVKANQWYHIALTRVTNTFTLYLNGIAQGTFDDFGSIAYSSTKPFTVGRMGLYAGHYLTGYISDARVTTGVALYNSNFYPGSAPATPTVTGPFGSLTSANKTSSATLLVNGTSSGIIDQTRTTTLETVADAKVVNGVSPYNGSYYSTLFNGSTDYFYNSSITLASTDQFTMECWIYPTSYTSYCPIWFAGTFGSDSSRKQLNIGTDGSINYFESNVGVQIFLAQAGAGTIPLNTWTHVAVTVTSGSPYVAKLFVNGTQVASSNAGTTRLTHNNIYIGYARAGAANKFTTGYISNFRMVVGSVLYSSTFTPSTTPLTAVSGTQFLTCQSNKFVDNSTNAYSLTLAGAPKIATQNPFQVNTGQSYYFDGTGDYLVQTYLAGNQPIQFNTGDYTVETWINPNNLTPVNGIFQIGNLKANTTASTGAITVYGGAAGTTLLLTGGTITGNAWSHVSLTRKSGVGTTLWINGTQSGPVVVDSTSYTSSNVYIGSASAGASPFTGYLSDFRITTSTARYTSNNTTYLNNGSPYSVK